MNKELPMVNQLTNGAVESSNDHKASAAYINAEFGAAQEAARLATEVARSSVQHALNAGLEMLRVRDRLGHGSILQWIKEETVVPRSTAYHWMNKAKEYKAALKIPIGNLSVDNAARMLTAEPDPEEPEAAPEGEIVDSEASDSQPEGDSEGDQEETDVEPEEQETAEDNDGGSQAVSRYVGLEQWNGMSRAKRVAAFKAIQAEYPNDRFNDQAGNTGIEWARWSWNPVTGCLHNCPYCYARDSAERFYEQKFAPSFYPGRLKAPKNTPFPEEKIATAIAENTNEGRWRAMALGNVFTCSMADLFGRWVPKEWIDAVLNTVKKAPQWNFLFLTKFPQRMAEFEFPDNAWVGTTVDCQARVANAEKAFKKIKAKVKWLSCEPLIEPLKFTSLNMFNWVVIGGSSESTQTPEWRPPSRWVVALTAAADNAGCRVYFKTNMDRVREYPGEEHATQAPEQLRYLPSDTASAEGKS